MSFSQLCSSVLKADGNRVSIVCPIPLPNGIHWRITNQNSPFDETQAELGQINESVYGGALQELDYEGLPFNQTGRTAILSLLPIQDLHFLPILRVILWRWLPQWRTTKGANAPGGSWLINGRVPVISFCNCFAARAAIWIMLMSLTGAGKNQQSRTWTQPPIIILRRQQRSCRRRQQRVAAGCGSFVLRPAAPARRGCQCPCRR